MEQNSRKGSKKITYDMTNKMTAYNPSTRNNNVLSYGVSHVNDPANIKVSLIKHGTFKSNNNNHNQENNSNADTTNELHKMKIGFILN